MGWSSNASQSVAAILTFSFAGFFLMGFYVSGLDIGLLLTSAVDTNFTEKPPVPAFVSAGLLISSGQLFIIIFTILSPYLSKFLPHLPGRSRKKINFSKHCQSDYWSYVVLTSFLAVVVLVLLSLFIRVSIRRKNIASTFSDYETSIL